MPSLIQLRAFGFLVANVNVNVWMHSLCYNQMFASMRIIEANFNASLTFSFLFHILFLSQVLSSSPHFLSSSLCALSPPPFQRKPIYHTHNNTQFLLYFLRVYTQCSRLSSQMTNAYHHHHRTFIVWWCSFGRTQERTALTAFVL